ncbi:MAG: TlyA family RNA methyltransferase, partial [Clostridia bacterium]|nr:TlyA family RNA methyltransferase [Clostridia bacterium]
MRLDKFLSDKFSSRTKAAEAIAKGLITVNGNTVSSSYEVKETDIIKISEAEENYVSAGGFKLAKALKDFSFAVNGKIFADVGASTGGFTDCLLQNGAKKVYCIDVGESQLSEKLKDKNIVIIDNFNARNLNKSIFFEELDGVVTDVSFISLTYILGGISNVLSDEKSVIALIKPQFECESRSVGKNGVVRDEKTRLKIIKKIYDFAVSVNLSPQKLTAV